MTDFAADINARARWVRACNGLPEPAWPTVERLIVALVLGDQATFDREGCTRQQALQWLSGDPAFSACTADAGTLITAQPVRDLVVGQDDGSGCTGERSAGRSSPWWLRPGSRSFPPPAPVATTRSGGNFRLPP